MTRRWEARLAAAAVATVAMAVVACDPDGFSDAPSSACSETGAQCQLPEGPLGVCERAACPPGAAPPCFTCTPQH